MCGSDECASKKVADYVEMRDGTKVTTRVDQHNASARGDCSLFDSLRLVVDAHDVARSG